jgi:hypothetical protein
MTSPLGTVERFDASNVLVSAVLGLIATASAVDHALAPADDATDLIGATDGATPGTSTPHPLDLALLGLVFVGRALDAVTRMPGERTRLDTSPGSATWADGDLLR